MRETALQLARRLFDEALSKFDWSASGLDANAIRLLNDAPGRILVALERAEQDAAMLDALANECTPDNPGFAEVFNRVTDADAPPCGPFRVLVDFEKTVDVAETLEEAREIARVLADEEPLAATFSIYDANEREVEGEAVDSAEMARLKRPAGSKP
jgi:hypothetical protein